MKYTTLTVGLSNEMLSNIQTLLNPYNLHFISLHSIQDTLKLLMQQIIHLIIVDLEHFRNIQQSGWLAEIRLISYVPLLILSDTPELDVMNMVQLGADMCISGKQSYSMIAELAYAQLRRYTQYNHYNNPVNAEIAPFRVGDIYIDPARQETRVCGQSVSLRHREFSLLLYFMRNPGIVLSAGQICENAWGMEYTQPIDRAVHELRKQIETNPRQPCYIQTVHRVGYRFTAYSSETCER